MKKKVPGKLLLFRDFFVIFFFSPSVHFFGSLSAVAFLRVAQHEKSQIIYFTTHSYVYILMGMREISENIKYTSEL